MADGSAGNIQHLGINEAIKTLGSMTCPSGSSKGALEYMQKKGMAWKDMIKAGNLSRRNVWFMMDKQFWPRISYGLCAVGATFHELSEGLKAIQVQHDEGVHCVAVGTRSQPSHPRCKTRRRVGVDPRGGGVDHGRDRQECLVQDWLLLLRVADPSSLFVYIVI